MDHSWTLPELVAEAAARLAALPPPKNGQVRPVPDERTFRYYSALGLIDAPLAMRGRTALYGLRHLAQLVAIKRLQGTGKALAEIRGLWPTLDDHTLARISGIRIPSRARDRFWKQPPSSPSSGSPRSPVSPPSAPSAPLPELRIPLTPTASLAITLPAAMPPLTPADLLALRQAAAPLLAMLADRNLIPPSALTPAVIPSPEEP